MTDSAMARWALIERGPEAEATRARLRDEIRLYQGEGVDVTAGRDGPTYCIYSDTGTLLDLLGDEPELAEGSPEISLRGGSVIQRFSTEAEQAAALSNARWQEDVRRRGWTITSDDVSQAHLDGDFRFELDAGLSATRMAVHARSSDGNAIVELFFATEAEPERCYTTEPGIDEWARFAAELRLLGIQQWGRYLAKAVDGLSWSLHYESLLSATVAGGANAYPPGGDGPDPTPQFVRLLLAMERLCGRMVWPVFDARHSLDHIPDDRDRIEHLLLSATRAWAHALESDQRDPSSIDEKGLEKGLLQHIQALDPRVDSQSPLRGGMADWPNVGPVDLRLARPGGDIWVELKWPKNRPNELHNCVFDAAKLAHAKRQGILRNGYLLAGMPTDGWTKAAASRLFEVSAHLESTLIGDYRQWWNDPGWQRVYPDRLPKPVITVPVGRVAFNAPSGAPWEVRIARVEAPGKATYDTRLG